MKLNGKVGIGTTSPQGRLHAVKGKGTVPSLSTGETFIFQNNDDINDVIRIMILGGNQVGSAIDFADSEDPFAGYISYNHNTLDFHIQNWNGGSYGDLVLNSYGGNVGIGTVSPGAELDVSGGVDISDTLAVGTDRLVVQSTGNVGIGTTSPSYKLHVNGDAAGTSPALSEVRAGQAGQTSPQESTNKTSEKLTP